MHGPGKPCTRLRRFVRLACSACVDAGGDGQIRRDPRSGRAGMLHGRGAGERGNMRGATRKTRKPAAAAPSPSQAAFAGGGGGEYWVEGHDVGGEG